MSLIDLIDGREQLPGGLLGERLNTVEILYEAEAPVIFIVSTHVGRMLAYVADEDAQHQWVLLAPCEDILLDDLKRGCIPVRDALTRSWTWLVRHKSGVVEGAWSIRPEQLPDRNLPVPGVLLHSEMEPIITTRAEGAQITRKATPASVVAFLADGTRKAVKVLLDHVMENGSQGRPSDDLRALYDLPIQSLAFGSFQISFAEPDTGLFEEPRMRRTVALLQSGLHWAARDDNTPSPGDSEEEREALLRALILLTPPSTGVIERVDVGGRWLSRGSVQLKRASRRRVMTELRKVKAERFVVHSGRIDELDKNGTFTLRYTDDGRDVRGYFDETLLDDLMESFQMSEFVTIFGIERSGRLFAAAVSRKSNEGDMPAVQSPPEHESLAVVKVTKE